MEADLIQAPKEILLKSKFSQKINSCSLDKAELRSFFRLLEERSSAAAQIEIASLSRRSDQSSFEFEEVKRRCREGFMLNLTVVGTEGQELFGPIEQVFDSPNFPDSLKSIYVNSSNPLRALYNYIPRNSSEVLLDFSKPDVFNWNLMPNQETPNGSNFIVEGYDATWVNGVYNEISRYIDKRRSGLEFLHKHTVYDILLWLAGLPFAFWVLYKLSDLITPLYMNRSEFLKSAIYVYVFFLSLIGVRSLFHYARWIWPLVDFRSANNKAMRHRVTLGGIILSIIASMIYDLAKSLF